MVIHFSMMIICGVSPLRGFPVGRRDIGHLVPILGGRRLAWLVRVWGGAYPSGGYQVDMAGQLVCPLPTPHGTLGGRRASEGYGPASDVSASVQPSAGRMRGRWHPRDATSRWCGAVGGNWNRSALPALLVLGSTPRWRASTSSKRSLRRGASSVTAVSGCRATGGLDHASARPRWSCDGVCPPRRLRRWWNGTRGSQTGKRSRAIRLPSPLVEATQQMPSSFLAWRLCQRAGPVGRQGAVLGGSSEHGAPPVRVSSGKTSRIRGSCVGGRGPQPPLPSTLVVAPGHAHACPSTWVPTSPSVIHFSKPLP